MGDASSLICCCFIELSMFELGSLVNKVGIGSLGHVWKGNLTKNCPVLIAQIIFHLLWWKVKLHLVILYNTLIGLKGGVFSSLWSRHGLLIMKTKLYMSFICSILARGAHCSQRKLSDSDALGCFPLYPCSRSICQDTAQNRINWKFAMVQPDFSQTQ